MSEPIDSCTKCGTRIPVESIAEVPAVNLTLDLEIGKVGEWVETCYHRCTACGHPHFGFFDEETGEHNDYRCMYCREPFIYSWTILANFMNCPRYGMFSIDLGRGKDSTAMHFGSCIHQAFDVLQRHRDLNEAIVIFREEYGLPPEWETLRTPERGEGIIRAFWHRFKDSPAFTAPGRNEVSGMIQLAPNLLYSVRIDRIPEDAGKPIILDYKTTAFHDRTEFVKTFNTSHQFTGYAYVASILIEKHIEDVEVWLIKVSKGTKTRTKAQMKDGAEPYDDAYNFTVLPQKRPDHRISAFLRTVKMYVGWWNECRREGFWPQQTEYCFHYQRACPYLEYCQMPFEQALKLLPEEFDLRHWDSIKGEETILARATGSRHT